MARLTRHMLWTFPFPFCLLFHAAQIKMAIDSSWAFTPFTLLWFYGKSQMTSFMEARKVRGGGVTQRGEESASL